MHASTSINCVHNSKSRVVSSTVYKIYVWCSHADKLSLSMLGCRSWNYTTGLCIWIVTTRVWYYLPLVTWTGWIGQKQSAVKSRLGIHMVRTPQGFSNAPAHVVQHVMCTWCSTHHWLRIDPGQCGLYVTNHFAIKPSVKRFLTTTKRSFSV